MNCPKCGACVEVLKESLKEKGTDNWEIARKIIGNCSECRKVLEDELRVV